MMEKGYVCKGIHSVRNVLSCLSVVSTLKGTSSLQGETFIIYHKPSLTGDCSTLNLFCKDGFRIG